MTRTTGHEAGVTLDASARSAALSAAGVTRGP
jgi:hypothetical protein